MKPYHLLLPLASFALAADLEVIKTHVPAECPYGVSQNGDTLAIHYRGFLEDGTEFFNTYARHRPYHFELGIGRVIKGWDQGLLGMCEGEKRTLVIPPELAYGDKKIGMIPPGNTLKFETELMVIYRPGQEGKPRIRPQGAKPVKVESKEDVKEKVKEEIKEEMKEEAKEVRLETKDEPKEEPKEEVEVKVEEHARDEL